MVLPAIAMALLMAFAGILPAGYGEVDQSPGIPVLVSNTTMVKYNNDSSSDSALTTAHLHMVAEDLDPKPGLVTRGVHAAMQHADKSLYPRVGWAMV